MQLLRRIPLRSGNNEDREMSRSQSQETLDVSTNRTHQIQPNPIQFLVRSNTSYSASTDSTAVDLVIGRSFSEFNHIRSLPIISMLFQKGIFIFPSSASLNVFKSTYKLRIKPRNLMKSRAMGNGLPLFHCVCPLLSSFKRSAPVLIIYKFDAPSIQNQNNEVPLMDSSFVNNKTEYCKVYCKSLRKGSMQYTLKFTPGNDEQFQVKLLMHPRFAFVDTIYKKTRLRWIGTTQLISLNGSGNFKLIIVNDDSPGLLDLDLQSSEPLTDYEPSRATVDAISNDFLANLSNFPPIARFTDSTEKTRDNIPQKIIFKSLGELKLLEIKQTNENNDYDNENNEINDNENTLSRTQEFQINDILTEEDSILNLPESTLVMTCMSLVLRDHEVRKTNGKSRGFENGLLGAGVFI